jgi:hypothetical protein
MMIQSLQADNGQFAEAAESVQRNNQQIEFCQVNASFQNAVAKCGI